MKIKLAEAQLLAEKVAQAFTDGHFPNHEIFEDGAKELTQMVLDLRLPEEPSLLSQASCGCVFFTTPLQLNSGDTDPLYLIVQPCDNPSAIEMRMRRDMKRKQPFMPIGTGSTHVLLTRLETEVAKGATYDEIRSALKRFDR